MSSHVKCKCLASLGSGELSKGKLVWETLTGPDHWVVSPTNYSILGTTLSQPSGREREMSKPAVYTSLWPSWAAPHNLCESCQDAGDYLPQQFAHHIFSPLTAPEQPNHSPPITISSFLYFNEKWSVLCSRYLFSSGHCNEAQWKVKYEQKQIHKVNCHDQDTTPLTTEREKAKSL